MLSVKGLRKTFPTGRGRVAALKGVDLDVAQGEFFVLVGASGSGKTTLLRCVAGLETPQAGEVRIAGRVVSSDRPPTWVPPQQRRLGMVFQSYAVWPHLSVFENVAMPLAEGSQRVPRAEISGRVREALRMVHLEGYADRPATLLSGGQQQRVAVARAIAVNPNILLMDEPLSNLDARLREEVREEIHDLAKRLGSTVLYVTHDQVEAMAVADKIALVRLGEVLQVGTPTELYRRPIAAEAAEFFGSINWLRGRIEAPGVVETPIGRLYVEAATRPGEQVLVGFRPEALTPMDGQALGQPNVFHAVMTACTYLGDQFLVRLLIRDQTIVAKMRAVPSGSAGPCYVRVDPADTLLFEMEQGETLGTPAERPARDLEAALG
jgi:iron(III) transport system ATP-binding protein